MPNIVYLWNFEDGTTQGWTLGGGAFLDSSGRVQGTYSIRLRISKLSDNVLVPIGSISNVSLVNVQKPFLVIVARLNPTLVYIGTLYECNVDMYVTVGDGSISRTTRHRVMHVVTSGGVSIDLYRIVVVSLADFVGRVVSITIGVTGRLSRLEPCDVSLDMIAVIDGGDYEYNINIRTFRDVDTGTITLNIFPPQSLPAGISIIGMSMADTPHPLAEDEDIFTYTLTMDTASISITSTDKATRHTNLVTPSTHPSTLNSISYRAFPRSSGTLYLTFMRQIVVVFMSASYSSYLLFMVLNVSININYIDKIHASREFRVQPNTLVTFSETFTMALAFSTLEIRAEVSIYRGSHTSLIEKTMTLSITDEQGNTISSVQFDINDDYVLSPSINIPLAYSMAKIRVTISGTISASSDVCFRIAIQTIAS